MQTLHQHLQSYGVQCVDECQSLRVTNPTQRQNVKRAAMVSLSPRSAYFQVMFDAFQAVLRKEKDLFLILQSNDILDCEFGTRIRSQLQSHRCGGALTSRHYASGVLYLGAVLTEKENSGLRVGKDVHREMHMKSDNTHTKNVWNITSSDVEHEASEAMCFNMWTPTDNEMNCVTGIYHRNALDELVGWMRALDAAAIDHYNACDGIAHLADLGYVTRAAYPPLTEQTEDKTKLAKKKHRCNH